MLKSGVSGETRTVATLPETQRNAEEQRVNSKVYNGRFPRCPRVSARVGAGQPAPGKLRVGESRSSLHPLALNTSAVGQHSHRTPLKWGPPTRH